MENPFKDVRAERAETSNLVGGQEDALGKPLEELLVEFRLPQALDLRKLSLGVPDKALEGYAHRRGVGMVKRPCDQADADFLVVVDRRDNSEEDGHDNGAGNLARFGRITILGGKDQPRVGIAVVEAVAQVL